MASKGPFYPGTATGDAWTSPSNLGAADGVYATCTSDEPGPITATNYNSGGGGFGVPAGATINGVEVTVSGHSDSGTFDDVVLFLVFEGGTLGSPKPNTGSGYPPAGSDAEWTFGSPTDLWGNENLNEPKVNSSTFGAQLSVEGGTSDVISLDFVRITVHYTPPPPPPPSPASSSTLGVQTVEIVLTRDAEKQILSSLIATDGLLDGCTLHLFTDSLLPGERTVIGDLTAPVFTGYAPFTLVPVGPINVSDGGALTFGHTFVCSAAPTTEQNVTGWYIASGETTPRLVYVALFDEVVSVVEAGDAVEVGGHLTLKG